MTGVLSIGIVSVLFVGLLFLFLNNPLEKAVQKGLAAQSIEPIVEQLAKGHPDAQPNLYHRAIGRLWSGHERELAATLVKHLTITHPEAKISQYWMNQVLTIEPALAKESFTDDFLARYFNPKIASQCGPAG